MEKYNKKEVAQILWILGASFIASIVIVLGLLKLPLWK